MNMKMNLVFVLLCIASMSTGAFAFTFLGTPTAGLEEGECHAGYVFSYGETDLDVSVRGLTANLKDVSITGHYFDLGYGMTDNLEFNVLLGMATGDIDKIEYHSLGTDLGFSGDNQFSWGFNAKYTFIEDEIIDWGAMFQMTGFNTEDHDAEFEAYDYQFTVGPTVDMNGWNLYGGAYFYMLDGEISEDSDHADIEEGDPFGGYIGASFEFMQNTSLALEGAFSGDTMGIGLSVLVGF